MMTETKIDKHGIVAIGEVLWDVFPNAEFLGGAPLNFCASGTRLGHSMTLISGVGADTRGTRILTAMANLGLSTNFVQQWPQRATGTAIITTDAAGNATYRFDRPAAFDDLALTEEQWATLTTMQPAWIYYGTLAQTNPTNQALLDRLLHLPGVLGFYDMNLRQGHWTPELVEQLAQKASVIKLNEEEARVLFAMLQPDEPFTLERFCRLAGSRFGATTLCITRGAKGCAIYQHGALALFKGVSIEVVDTVGAGDAFAAAFLHGLMKGYSTEENARFANAVGALVASRPGPTPMWTPDECNLNIGFS